jgi:tRNA nucleotidyltransferase/poly(A) polymerase
VTDHDPGDEHAPPAPSTPAPGSTWFALSALRTANAIACRLGGPVYLVGGALVDVTPHDYDVRVVLTEAELERLFGKHKGRGSGFFDWSEQDLRRGREQLKQSRRMSRRFRCNVDFQIQTVAEHEGHVGRPRLRLDSVPDETFLAGVGDA